MASDEPADAEKPADETAEEELPDVDKGADTAVEEAPAKVEEATAKAEEQKDEKGPEVSKDQAMLKTMLHKELEASIKKAAEHAAAQCEEQTEEVMREAMQMLRDQFRAELKSEMKSVQEEMRNLKEARSGASDIPAIKAMVQTCKTDLQSQLEQEAKVRSHGQKASDAKFAQIFPILADVATKIDLDTLKTELERETSARAQGDEDKVTQTDQAVALDELSQKLDEMSQKLQKQLENEVQTRIAGDQKVTAFSKEIMEQGDQQRNDLQNQIEQEKSKRATVDEQTMAFIQDALEKIDHEHAQLRKTMAESSELEKNERQTHIEKMREAMQNAFAQLEKAMAESSEQLKQQLQNSSVQLQQQLDQEQSSRTAGDAQSEAFIEKLNIEHAHFRQKITEAFEAEKMENQKRLNQSTEVMQTWSAHLEHQIAQERSKRNADHQHIMALHEKLEGAHADFCKATAESIESEKKDRTTQLNKLRGGLQNVILHHHSTPHFDL